MYLGQLVPASADQGLTLDQIIALKSQVGSIAARKVEVLVTSANKLKMQAAVDSVSDWLKEAYGVKDVDVSVKGYGVSSEIDEQPHGLEHTKQGAINRLNNLKKEILEKEKINVNDGVLRVLISLENGIMKEKLEFLKNKAVFETEEDTAWVDRCVEMGEIWVDGREWKLEGVSEGVTTPKAEVEKSKESNWSKTTGSFIAVTYECPSADWHGKIAGKNREAIMRELCKTALSSK